MSGLPEGTLTCEDPSGPSLLYFTYQDSCCEAVVIRVVEQGLLLSIPSGGIDPQVFRAAEDEGYPGLLGPYTEVACKVHHPRARRTLSVLIFDIDAFDLSCLSAELPAFFDQGAVTRFGSYRGAPDHPSGPHLLQLADNFVRAGGVRLDHYFSAVEEGPAAEDGGDLSGADEQSVLLKRLLAQSEVTQRTVTGMKDKIETIGRLEARLDRLEGGGPRPAPRRQAASSPQLFDLEAPQMDTAQLDRLKGLAGRGPGKLADIGASAKSMAVAPTGITADAAEEDLDGEPLEAEGSGTLEKLLSSQTLLLQHLVQAKTRQADPLSMLSVGPSLESDDMPKSSGVRGIAARQLLVESFRRQPSKVVQIFKERLMLARRKGSISELEPRDLWYHFQDQVPLGSHRTLTHMSFIAAAMYEAMERGDLERVKMLVVMQAVFTEQACYDGGGLRMAHLLTGLDDPPFSQTELHRTANPLYAHGQLADPRWVAANLAYLKDLEGISEKSGKYVRPQGKGNEAAQGDDTSKKNGKQKKKGGKKGGSEAVEEEG